MPTFSAQLLGQTEKAANTILDRLLAQPGLTEPQWVTLTITAMSGGTLDRSQLGVRISGALKVNDAEAQTRIAELATVGLLHVSADEGSTVKLTDAGERLHADIRVATMQVTRRLWGDLPAQDLETAGRVLSTVLARANQELGEASKPAAAAPVV